MDARTTGNAAASNIYTFEPLSDLIQEEDCNTLLLYLPGFTKEQLKVQLTRSRVLKISGSRPIGDKMSNFQKDFPVSENIDTNKITAKFEDGILYVRQPKLIVPAEKDDQKTPQPAAEETPAAPKTNQERQPTAPKTTPPEADSSKQTGAKDFTEKSKEKKEEKPSKKEEKSSKKEEKGGQSEGGKRDVRDKSGGVDHDKNVAAGKSDGDKRRENHDKNVAAGKSDGDKRREKISGSNNVNAEAEVYNYNKVNAAAMLKMAREKTMKILLFLFAFALGIYVSRLRWVSREVEN